MKVGSLGGRKPKARRRRLTFPLVARGRKGFPREALCPICERARVFESHSFVCLSGGALLMDRRKRSGGPDDDLDAWLHVVWLGAHDGGEGRHRDVYVTVPFAKSVRGGQFEIYVCSTKCLRRLFREWVDRIEAARRDGVREMSRARAGRPV